MVLVLIFILFVCLFMLFGVGELIVFFWIIGVEILSCLMGLNEI